MTYTAVDPAINAWADGHKLKLCTEFGGEERRFCYVTGGLQECFQISIEPPEGGLVLVNAWSIETIDDAELHESWVVPVDKVDAALNLAFDQIRAWNARPKGSASWQPPTSWGQSA